MTVSSNLNKHIYEGDGVTVNWPYTFKINDASEIQVYITPVDGNPALILTGYSVDTGNSRVVYPSVGSALATGEKITLLRVVPITQLTDWKNQGPFNAETVETALDKVTMALQQHDEEIARSIKFGVDATPLDEELENAGANAAAAAASAIAAAASAVDAAASAVAAAASADDSSDSADASAASAALSAQYMPAGALLPFAAAAAPSGFYLCDGSAKNRVTDATLFAVIGTTWGVGDGSTTFNIPDLRGKIPVGKDSGTFSALAAAGGAETHAHTQAAHGHTVNAHNHSISTDGSHDHGGVTGTFTAGAQANAAGPTPTAPTHNHTISSAGSHNHGAQTGNDSPGTDSATPTINAGSSLQPYAVVNYIIKR